MTLRVTAAAVAVTSAFAVTGGIHPTPASAATTITVNTTLDEAQAGDGACSLREATLYANGTAEPDCAAAPASGVTTITLPGGTYLLNGQALSLTGDAAINGAGANTTTINANGKSLVLGIASGAHVTVSGVTVTGGQNGAACTGNMCVGLGLAVSGFPGGGIVNAGTLTLTGVTVSGNRTSPGADNETCTQNQKFGCAAGNGGDGGGIFNDKTGTLTIASSVISGNSTGAGGVGTVGAPASGGGRSGNGGNGGGISNLGALTITNSTIAANATGAGGNGQRGGDGTAGTNNGDAGDGSNAGAGGSGGGIENNGPLVISGTTFVGNRTGGGGTGGDGGFGSGAGRHGTGGAGGNGGSGGAIDSSTDMTVANSTVVANATAGGGGAGAGNTPGGFPPALGQPGIGGGIDQHAMGTTLTHVTVTANSAAGNGGGVDGAGGTITIANSIIAGNVAAPPTLNCAGVLVDQGGNLEFAAASCPAGFLQANPKLTGLANNGGPTQTIALQPGSAAIHHVRTCVLTHDQRGVARPVGAACDSGAYQVAPPSLSGISAGGITTTSAAIAAAVNPNLQDAKVVVNYGLTPSYGSSTPPQDLGSGNAPAPFTAALAGLQPGTTYHFDVVTTNADGTTTSSDGTFTTLPPLTASITGASTVGPALALTIACDGGFGPGECAGTIGLTSRAATKHRHAVTVAAGSYSVPSGNHATVRIRLNRVGRRLLTEHYSLSSTLSLRGTTQLTRRVSFRYPRIRSGMPFDANFNGPFTVFSQLTVLAVPRGGKVTVTCRGGGCPVGHSAFSPRHGLVVLGPTFRHALLASGASIQIEVSAANRVAKVETLTVRSGQGPIVDKQCLPPGASRPAQCVKAK
jgi:CSLREA domain-containing protein